MREVKKSMTQSDVLLKHLLLNGTVVAAKCPILLSVMSPRARKKNLLDRGWPIDIKYIYRADRSGAKRRIGVYFIQKEKITVKQINFALNTLGLALNPEYMKHPKRRIS